MSTAKITVESYRVLNNEGVTMRSFGSEQEAQEWAETSWCGYYKGCEIQKHELEIPECIIIKGKHITLSVWRGFVLAGFKAQATSWSCQGQWGHECISIKAGEFTLEKLRSKFEKAEGVHWY